MHLIILMEHMSYLVTPDLIVIVMIINLRPKEIKLF